MLTKNEIKYHFLSDKETSGGVTTVAISNGLCTLCNHSQYRAVMSRFTFKIIHEQ